MQTKVQIIYYSRWQRDERVSAGNAQRLEVLGVAGQQQQTRVLRQRRNGDIRKAGVAAMGVCLIRYLPRQSGGLCIQRQNALCIRGQQSVQPAV